MKWKQYNPDFDFRPDCKSHTWFGHCFFAYDLIRNVKPKVIVELGTYYATSFSSFCQAVRDENIDSNLYAVDSWEGDENAGLYGEYVYTHAKAQIAKYYPEVKSHLMRMYFDDAVPEFKDHSIDLLHIDGLHTYEAVKHDFETWFPKVSKSGVIMFHDIYVEHYGVKDLWAELQKQHPEWAFVSFEHNYGLGVIFLDKKQFEDLMGETYLERPFIEHYSDMATASVGMRQIINVETDRNHIRKELELTDQLAKQLLKEKSDFDAASAQTQLYNQIRSRKAVKILNRILKLVGKPLY